MCRHTLQLTAAAPQQHHSAHTHPAGSLVRSAARLELFPPTRPGPNSLSRSTQAPLPPALALGFSSCMRGAAAPPLPPAPEPPAAGASMVVTETSPVGPTVAATCAPAWRSMFSSSARKNTEPGRVNAQRRHRRKGRATQRHPTTAAGGRRVVRTLGIKARGQQHALGAGADGDMRQDVRGGGGQNGHDALLQGRGWRGEAGERDGRDERAGLQRRMGAGKRWSAGDASRHVSPPPPLPRLPSHCHHCHPPIHYQPTTTTTSAPQPPRTGMSSFPVSFSATITWGEVKRWPCDMQTRRGYVL